MELPVPLPVERGRAEGIEGCRCRFRCRLVGANGRSDVILERDLIVDEFSPALQVTYAGVLGALTLGIFLAL